MLCERRVRGFFLALAIVSVVPIAAACVATPAAARASAGAEAGAVLNACDRTPHCMYSQDPNSGEIHGCSLNSGTCFYCPADGKSKCYSVRRQPNGKAGIGTGKIGGIKLTPPPRGYHPPINAGGSNALAGGPSKARATYGRSTGPTNPNGPDISGKEQGAFKSVGRHR